MKTASKITGIILTALFILTGAYVPLSAEAIVKIAYNGDPEKFAPWKLVHLATEGMFRRIGIKLEYRIIPAKRAGLEADNGNLDGDNARVYGYGEKFPNLLRVGEPVYTQVLAAYSVDPSVNIEGWESFRKTGYRVEYLRGVIFVEMNLRKAVPPENLSNISTREQGLRKLASGRTDVFVDVKGLIESLLSRKEFRDLGIRQAGVLETNPLYLFLNRKHAAMIPRLEKALIQIKSEGLYNEYQQQAFGKNLH